MKAQSPLQPHSWLQVCALHEHLPLPQFSGRQLQRFAALLLPSAPVLAASPAALLSPLLLKAGSAPFPASPAAQVLPPLALAGATPLPLAELAVL